MITKSKQAWEVGQTVKVGFLSGLTVLAKVATPGDGAPDVYVLGRGTSVYSFVPHNGLTKISEAEARAMVAKAAWQKANAESAAMYAATLATDAAAFRAELMSISA
jgi:hypothetical protein